MEADWFFLSPQNQDAKDLLAAALTHPSLLLTAHWLLCPISMAPFAVALSRKGEVQVISKGVIVCCGGNSGEMNRKP